MLFLFLLTYSIRQYLDWTLESILFFLSAKLHDGCLVNFIPKSEIKQNDMGQTYCKTFFSKVNNLFFLFCNFVLKLKLKYCAGVFKIPFLFIQCLPCHTLHHNFVIIMDVVNTFLKAF